MRSIREGMWRGCIGSGQVDNSAPRLTDTVQALSVKDRAGEYSSGRVPKLRIILDAFSRVETLSSLAPYFLLFQ